MLTNAAPLAHRINTQHPYTPSYATDIRKTFERERRRLEREAFAKFARHYCPNDERFVDAA